MIVEKNAFNWRIFKKSHFLQFQCSKVALQGTYFGICVARNFMQRENSSIRLWLKKSWRQFRMWMSWKLKKNYTPTEVSAFQPILFSLRALSCNISRLLKSETRICRITPWWRNAANSFGENFSFQKKTHQIQTDGLAFLAYQFFAE